MNLLQKVWKRKGLFLYILHSIYFNFRYLPFKQAIKLPILLYKPRFQKLGGVLLIDSQRITFGMIKLGCQLISLFPPYHGIAFSNNGTIIFKGKCFIGANSSFSVAKGATAIFGDNFGATSNFNLVCYKKITFNKNVLFGWESLVMDTDLHKLTKLDGSFSKGYGEVNIGANNWFGCKCSVFKNTVTPNYCVISTGSILNKKYDFPEHSLIGASYKIEVKVDNIYLDRNNNKINYE